MCLLERAVPFPPFSLFPFFATEEAEIKRDKGLRVSFFFSPAGLTF